MSDQANRAVGTRADTCLTIDREEVCDGQTGRSGGDGGDPLLGVDDGCHLALAAGLPPVARQRKHARDDGGTGGKRWISR